MKASLLCALLLMSQTAAADGDGLDPATKKLRENHCENFLGGFLRQKLGPNTYEVWYPDGIIQILKTKKTKVTQTGQISFYLYGVPKGTLKVTMRDGFEKEVPIFEESELCLKIHNDAN